MKKSQAIGTPLSRSSTKVMLLGSGELGKEVIIAFQRFGIETIAVDRYPNAPGHQVAHRSYTIDMANAAALRELIKHEQPDIIVPEIEAIATDVLIEIERDGVARIIPTARAAQLTMHREGIRRLAAETLKLPTSNYAFASSLQELRAAIDDGIGYPCIIKPVISSSGKGQSKVHHAAEVSMAWDAAAKGGRVNQGRVIVEGVINFEYEITQLTVRSMGEHNEIQTHFCEPIGHIQINGDYVESWQPQIMSELALERTRAISKKITDNLGGLGIFGIELFVKGDDVWFSEVSPRPHDTGMVTMCSQLQNEFELHARAILGLPVNTALRTPGASAVIYGQLEGTSISFIGVDNALRVPQSDVRLFGKPESFLKRRMGVALATGIDTDEARMRAKMVCHRITTVDT
ncbi:MAG: formate-dependent phosphoribosylglycinamide formyltransferase [Candidatus Nitrotoga sp.]|nr:formate-dependent phosphoribosylglycinamide formyltransferase [Candidatus Nitrotoga sp.]MBP0117671.1 formate-dependent phosphoribosylglycinamide formyltransferase [Candidatus Nitrotoga sp.]MBP0125684.1 formate-dependent phosphoribosylglycinamide formyltransferase [Candidatus Nitrotoga sp.]